MCSKHISYATSVWLRDDGQRDGSIPLLQESTSETWNGILPRGEDFLKMWDDWAPFGLLNLCWNWLKSMVLVELLWEKNTVLAEKTSRTSQIWGKPNGASPSEMTNERACSPLFPYVRTRWSTRVSTQTEVRVEGQVRETSALFVWTCLIDKPWLKVLLADLVWEKILFIGW